jgi:hypothetical protein
MPDRAQHVELEGKPAMWAEYATSSCDRVRAKSPPPKLDVDGLFDVVGVVEIAGRRQCTVTICSDLLLTITAKAPIPVVALAPGRWEPISILAACTRAQGRKAFEVDESTAMPENEGGLDEIRIARVVAADGLRPYLARPGGYEIDDERAEPGMPTLAFLSLITGDGREYYVTRRALRALEDAGLVTIEFSPQGGMKDAEITWTERAYFPRPTPHPIALEEEDDRALECMALGIL